MALVTRQGPSTLPNDTNPNNMTPESVQAMINQALLRNSINGDGSHSSHEDNRRNVQTARLCFYADFMKCQPLNFKGTEGVVGLTRWIEKMELVFQIIGCAIKNQVKFATCTLLDAALTWWNSQIRSLGPDAYSMTWEVLKKKITDKYCPQGEIKKLEIELWNLKVKENNVPAYNEHFQELTLICTKFVVDETEKINKYVNGLPDNIYGSVKDSKPKTLDETIELANNLMDQKLRTYAKRQSNNKRKADDSFRNNRGHFSRDYRSSGNTNVANAQRNNGANPKRNGCFECGATVHFKKDCPKLKNKDVERFMNYIEEQTDGEAMINSIKNVSIAGTSSNEQPPLKDKSMWSDQEKRIQKIDRLARSLLIQGLLNDIYSLIDSNMTAKDLWDALARHMLGSEYDEQDRKAAVLYEYETFKATEGELLLDTYIRYLQVINDLKKCGYSKDNCELNFKFLNNLQPVWKQYATMTRQNKNLKDINIDALYNILKQNQGDVNDAIGSRKKTVVVTSDPLAVIAEKTNVSRSKEKVVVSSDSEGSEADDFSELKKITALLAKAFNRRKFYSKPTNKNLRTSSTSQTVNNKQEFV
nr:hypothetical protein [Tanacetum cinerariifolium]